jgi:Transporter associated domain
MSWSSAEVGDQHAAALRPAEPAAVKLDDGSYLISGWMPAIEFAELPKIALPVSRQYQTIAGRRWAWLGWSARIFRRRLSWSHRGAKGGQGASASAPDATGSRISPSGGNFGPRLRRGVVNANLQHRKPRFQFAGSVGGAFYRDELRF